MTEYSARGSEMDKAVDELSAKAIEEERRGGTPAVLATYLRVKAGVGAYSEWRDRAWGDGLKLVNAESGAKAEAQQERWSQFFLGKGAEASRTLTDLTSRDPDPIQWTFELLATQEFLSFQAISQMPLARFQGQAREYLDELNKMSGDLESKWSEIVGLDERQDGQIAGLRVQILDTFQKTVSDARGWGPKIEEAARKLVTGWDTEEQLDPEPSFSGPVRNAMEILQMLQRTLAELTRAALPMYSAEQRVHEMFGNIRLYVQEHLEKVTPDVIAKMYSEACRESLSRAESCPKDGQKVDAKKLADKAIRESERVVGEFKSAFDAFCSKFDGRFTGEVSGQTVEMLAEQEFFDKFWRDVQGLDLPGVFRSASDQLERCESITLDKLTDDQRREFQKVIREQLAPLREQIQAMDPGFFERFKIAFIDSTRGAIVEKLRRLPGFRK